MMSRNAFIERAIRVAILAGSATLVVVPGTAIAQSAAQSADALETVVVTGSRIRRADAETAQPVAVISREDIDNQGFTTVADILQNTTVTGAPPISRASPLSAGENAGGNYISLRNLGAARTLVLVNGRRMPVSTSGLADVSLLPSVAVERLDILKDGASSIYGSDAIGGVINLITRSKFTGTMANVYYGEYGEGDGTTKRVDFITGIAGERGSITVAAEWADEERVRAADRDFSAFPRSSLHPTDGWTVVGQFGGFQTTATTPIPGVASGTRVVLIPGADPRLAASYRAQNTASGTCAGATEATGCTPGSIADKSNTNLQTDLRTPIKRRSVNVDGLYDINDAVSLRIGTLYSVRESERQVAGFPMQAASFAGTLPGTVATPMAATSYFNPTGATISNWWRRSWEIPRVSGSDLTTFQISGSLFGDFEFADRSFSWDVGYLHANNDSLQSTYGNWNLTRTALAVGPSFLNAQGVVQCGTAAAPIAPTACVPLNPFLPFGQAGQGSLANKNVQDFIFQTEQATGQTTTTVFSANLTGDLFELPAGDIGFAIGAESRKEAGAFTPDPLAITGSSTNLSSGPTKGQYTVDEFYGELSIPILSDMPFAEALNLSLASRYSDYDTFGDTTNSKVGLEWRPMDGLLVRGTWAEGFRAPTIADLFGGGSQTFSFFTDPCDTNFGSSATNPTTRANCVAAFGALANSYRQLAQGFTPATAPNAQTPVAFTSGSNPTLEPETSVSKTAGIVWSPSFVPGLNMALDWWTIRIDNTIVADSPSQILSDCYVQSITSRCSPALFTRDPAQGYVNFLSFGSRNAGYREVEGYDLELGYRFTTERFGNFTLSSTTTYTDKDVTVATNDPRAPISAVGQPGIFKIRSNLGLNWQYGDFGISWNARYYSEMYEACTYFIPGSTTPNLECNNIQDRPTGLLTGTTSQLTRRNYVGGNTFNDVQFRWNTPWKGTLAVGANNVLDRVGPVMYSQPSANVSYYGGFDIGRFGYVKYTQKF
jgi:iron complex outermembrane receptor protein